MKKGGGKQKGAAFERQICKDLSRFIDPKGTETLFWRSAMSGGRATVQHRKGQGNANQAGDLTCIDAKGFWLTETFVVECKFYKDLNVCSGLIFGKGKLAEFWREVCKISARQKDKSPLLIARQNNMETLVIFDLLGWSRFKAFGHLAPFTVESKRLGRRSAVVCLYNEIF